MNEIRADVFAEIQASVAMIARLTAVAEDIRKYKDKSPSVFHQANTALEGIEELRSMVAKNLAGQAGKYR